MIIKKLLSLLQNTPLARLWVPEGGNSPATAGDMLGGNSAPESATAAPSPQTDDPFSLDDDSDWATEGAEPMKL